MKNRRIRSWTTGCVLVITLLTAGACGGGKTTTVRDLNALGTAVDHDLVEYLALTAPKNADAQTWFVYFEKGANVRVSLRSNFDKWSLALDDAIAHGEKPRNASATQGYRDTLGKWLSDQEEQARLTQGCFDSGKPTPNTTSCFHDMLAKNQKRWAADTSALNQARASSQK